MPLDQDFNKEEEEEGNEMSFIGHLEALRWHVIRAGASIIVFAIIAFVYIREIYQYIIIAPAKPNFWTYKMLCKLSVIVGYDDLCVKELNFTLQALGLGDNFTMSMTSSLIAGLVFAFPYAFWEGLEFYQTWAESFRKKIGKRCSFLRHIPFPFRNIVRILCGNAFGDQLPG